MKGLIKYFNKRKLGCTKRFVVVWFLMAFVSFYAYALIISYNPILFTISMLSVIMVVYFLYFMFEFVYLKYVFGEFK